MVGRAHQCCKEYPVCKDINKVHRYSDVPIMSDPILSGSRLQLTYNLYHTGPCDKQSASSIMAQHGSFRKSLANLRKSWQKSEAPSLLVYVLDEKYNDLKLSALGQDEQHRAEFLKKNCAEGKFCLYLAEMETRVDTDETRMLELKKIVDLDGADLMCDVELDEEGLIQSDYVDSRDSFEGETYCNCGDFDECECERHFEDTVCCTVFIILVVPYLRMMTECGNHGCISQCW